MATKLAPNYTTLRFSSRDAFAPSPSARAPGRAHFQTSTRAKSGCELCKGRQSNHGGAPRRASLRDWQPRREHLDGGNGRKRSIVVTGALPTAVTAIAAVIAVGSAIYALTKMNKESIPAFQEKKQCEVCEGSGLCSSCKGEGFVNKNLSEEAAAKARARAVDAATRYTAGLAKKWSYCTTCGGQRGCQSCDGRGWIDQK